LSGARARLSSPPAADRRLFAGAGKDLFEVWDLGLIRHRLADLGLDRAPEPAL
jgi:hypothetical protein